MVRLGSLRKPRHSRTADVYSRPQRDELVPSHLGALVAHVTPLVACRPGCSYRPFLVFSSHDRGLNLDFADSKRCVSVTTSVCCGLRSVAGIGCFVVVVVAGLEELPVARSDVVRSGISARCLLGDCVVFPGSSRLPLVFLHSSGYRCRA